MDVNQIKLTQYSHGAGCGCKISPAILDKILHSKLSFAHRVVRQVRVREPSQYMSKALTGDAVTTDAEVSRADLPFEFMLNALRLKEGFKLHDFVEKTGLPFTAIAKGLDEAESKGLIERDFVSVKPTVRGYDFLNDLQQLFLA